jgi:hypothetical protein
MEAIEDKLDPLQNLKIILDVISKTKEDIKSYSFLYLLWGWLIATASFLFFTLHTFTSFKLFFIPFPILVFIGILITIVDIRYKQHASETYLAFFIKNLWIVLGCGFILVVFINVVQQYPPFTYTLLIGGIGTLVSGLTLRFKPLIAGGTLFFIFSVASVFVNEKYHPLLQGIAVISGYLVPGYFLKYSKHNPDFDV